MLTPILAPRSIAVVGASRRPGTIGHEVLANLVRGGFTGPVYPVHPQARAVRSMRAWSSVRDLPDQVDLAVVIVPADQVLAVAGECAEAGVRGLVVISSGFREAGGEGAVREAQLAAFVRDRGIRMVGPNCMGVLNADPAVSMNATFFRGMPPHGRAAFMSQSGAMGLSVLDHAREARIGIAQFVSLGNKPDVSGNDLLLAWERDPAVGVILMYVESFGNPRRFREIASAVSRTKPIIVVKAGRSASGAAAASSHTGALAADDVAVDALLRQAGVLRAESVEELFDLAMAFSGRPAPRSRRTAVLTNAGGPGILAADALEAHGMDLPALADATTERLRPHFPAYASIRNPLDMVASATPEGYRSALSALLDDPEIDSVVPIFVPPLGAAHDDVTEAIVEAARGAPRKPVIPVLMGQEGLPTGRAALAAAGIPAYVFPESAARALAALCRWGERVAAPSGRPERHPVDREGVRGIIADARVEGRTRLRETDALAVLDCYGIPTAPSALARSAEDALALAGAVGYPVVLKGVSACLVHKSDVGAVRSGLRNAVEVLDAYRRIVETVGRRAPDVVLEGVLVQRHIEGGRELIAGITRDPAFGPLVMVGLGGVYVEVLRDVVFRVSPITRADAQDMLSEFRASGILDAVRGDPAADRRALEDILIRLSQLAADFPEIVEIDCNPLMALPDGAAVADGRVLLTEGPTQAPAKVNGGFPLLARPVPRGPSGVPTGSPQDLM